MTGPRKATTPRITRQTPAAPATPVTPDTVCLPVPIHRYRVLFADGALVDYLAHADHSGMREQMLDTHYGKRPQTERHNDPTYRIEGVAHLGQEYVYMPAPANRQDEP